VRKWIEPWSSTTKRQPCGFRCGVSGVVLVIGCGGGGCSGCCGSGGGGGGGCGGGGSGGNSLTRGAHGESSGWKLHVKWI